MFSTRRIPRIPTPTRNHPRSERLTGPATLAGEGRQDVMAQRCPITVVPIVYNQAKLAPICGQINTPALSFFPYLIFSELSKPRGPPKAYIIGLENKMEKLEALLRKLRPDTDFSDDLGPPVTRDSWKNDGRVKSETPSFDIATTPSYLDFRSSRAMDDCGIPLHLLPEPRLSPAPHMDQKRYQHRSTPESDSSAMSDEILFSSSDSEPRTQSPTAALSRTGTDEVIHFADDLQSLRFHGRSSVPGLVDATIKYRQNLLRGSENMDTHTQSGSPSDDSAIRYNRRAEFWRMPKWELVWEGYEHFDTKGILDYILDRFPPPELASNLIDLYFEHTNSFFPLLHRPTFERQYFKDRLYAQDYWFAGVCHTLFAVASRWSDDPRVIPRYAKTQTGDIDWSRAGWDHFNIGLDMHRARRSLFLPVTLFEMQTVLLLTLFLRYSSLHPASWVTMGVGFRKAQDVGAHRKKLYGEKPSVDRELWKRCFWLLILYDIVGAATLGRTCCISQEDYDLDLPLEVDDEYWETDDPTKAFKQPEGVPCKVTMFIYAIKIVWILAFILKTLYSTNKSASFVPKTRGSKERLLKQIETAIDEWLKSLPDHLRWSETADNLLFGSQSALLSLFYYVTQLVAYRPFITLRSVDHPRQTDRDDESSCSIAAKAMSLSTAAARAIVRLMKAQASLKIKHMAGIFHSSYYAAGQLLLRLWQLKVQERARKEKKDVMKDSSSSGQSVDETIDEVSSAQEIDELIADLRSMIEFYEGVQARWDFVQPVLERLRESMPKDGEMPHPGPWYQQVQQPPNYRDVEASQSQYSFPTLPTDAAEFVRLLRPHDQQGDPFYLAAKTFSVGDYSSNASLQASLPQISQSYGSETIPQQYVTVSQPESYTQQVPPCSPVELQKVWPARESQPGPFDARRTEAYSVPNQCQNTSYPADYHKGTTAQSSEPYGVPETASQIASVMFDPLYPRDSSEVQEDGFSLECPLCGGKPSQCSLAACTTSDLRGPAILNPEGTFETTSAYSGGVCGSNVTGDQPYYCPDTRPDSRASAILPRLLDRYSDQTGHCRSGLPQVSSQQVWSINDPSPFVNMSQ
ncbi:hypothetical protein AX15_002827 [Amanita polypyramis BW_CC]|nr:hypothetical protein AX15_002827 [Amanita polypyramis BW_CC]